MVTDSSKDDGIGANEGIGGFGADARLGGQDWDRNRSLEDRLEVKWRKLFLTTIVESLTFSSIWPEELTRSLERGGSAGTINSPEKKSMKTQIGKTTPKSHIYDGKSSSPPKTIRENKYCSSRRR